MMVPQEIDWTNADPTDEQRSERRRIHVAWEDAAYTFKLHCRSLGMSEEMLVSAWNKGIDYIKAGQRACESTIERIMVAPLVLADWAGFGMAPTPVYLPDSDEPAPIGDLLIVPQFKFGRYRADFAIIARHDGCTKVFFVECDGREFHMDQAKDQARDSYLKALGVTLIRLTGRDINSSPAGAAQRVVFVVTAWKADQ